MKSVCVLCMYICLFFRTHVSKPYIWSLKAACIQIIKAKQSVYYTHAQASSASKVCFFPYGKQGRRSDSPQTSKPAFLVDSSGVLQPKNSVLGLISLQGMHAYLVGWKVSVTGILTQTKMKSIPEALLEEC